MRSDSLKSSSVVKWEIQIQTMHSERTVIDDTVQCKHRYTAKDAESRKLLLCRSESAARKDE